MNEYRLGQFVVRFNYFIGEGLYHYSLVLDGDTVYDTNKNGGFESRADMDADILAQIRNIEQES